MGAGASALPATLDRAAAQAAAGEEWDEIAFESAAVGGFVTKAQFLAAGEGKEDECENTAEHTDEVKQEENDSQERTHGPKLSSDRLPDECPSPVPKDKAAWTLACDHIRDQRLLPVFDSFADSRERWRPLPLVDRGLSLRFFADFHARFQIKHDFSFLAVLWLVQILTAVTGFSLAEVMGDTKDADGVPYRGRSNRFVSHATAHTSFEDYDALASYEASGGGGTKAEDETLYYFVDVFGINQSDVGGTDELPKLEELIKACGHTVLIFNKWHDPEVVRR